MKQSKLFCVIAVLVTAIAAFAALSACSSPTDSTPAPVPAVTITTHPGDTELTVGGTGSLSVTAVLSGGATDIRYQWYRNTTANNVGGTLINGATTASYTIPTTAPGISYYYCEVSATGVAAPVRSTIAKVTVSPVSQTPTITIIDHPKPDTPLETGSTGILSVRAVLSGGATDIRYQWYSNTSASNEGGTKIDNASTANFTIPTTAPGISYYYCEVTATGVDTPKLSDVAKVTVSDPVPAINITKEPESTKEVVAGYRKGEILSVEASGVNNAGTLTYQWYAVKSADSYDDPAPETGASAANFTIPDPLPVGAYYYFCEIKAANMAEPKRSQIATVTVIAPVPTIEITTQPASPAGVLTVGGINGSLTVEAKGDYGITDTDLKYQWYSNTTASSVGGTQIDGATAKSFPIPTNLTAPNLTEATYYYFCEITATGAAAKYSNPATVRVKNPDTGFEVNFPNSPSVSITREGIAGTSFEITSGAEFSVTSDFTASAWQWSVDGEEQPGATSSYTFDKAAGTYGLTVVVTDAAGEKYSASCRVTVK